MSLKPLLKWAGGKRWLLPILKELWKGQSQNTLVEPFVGGLSVALGLDPNKAVLNDANSHLINFYQQIQKGFKISTTVKSSFQNNSKYYYEKRIQFNTLIRCKKYLTPEAARLFYFLIRTGYNGLSRFNLQGEFNVPFGKHKNIIYKKDFLDYKPIFKKWTFSNLDFEDLTLKGDEFLYADPPYDVEFTKYHAGVFEWNDQLRLANWLSKHKGPVIASNQATPRILELYRDLKFKVLVLSAPRRISCTGNRDPALEMLAVKNMSLHNHIKMAIEIQTGNKA